MAGLSLTSVSSGTPITAESIISTELEYYSESRVNLGMKMSLTLEEVSQAFLKLQQFQAL
jgi:hypothetical protein